MKISNRRRRTYSLAVFCALTSIFLILNGCGDDDDGGGVPLKVTYSISGQTTLDNGSGLSGVTMALTGASSDNVITDASGNYAFTGLDNCWEGVGYSALLSHMRQDAGRGTRADNDGDGVLVSEIRPRTINRGPGSLRVRRAGSEGEEGGTMAILEPGAAIGVEEVTVLETID